MKDFIRQQLKKIKFMLFQRRGIFFKRSENDYYLFHQNKLRGSESDIKKRQRKYISYAKKLPRFLTSQSPFLDCGFGRGEFLELLRENGVKNIEGVDSNEKYVESAKKKKFNVIKDNAIRHLYLTDKEYRGISAFHLIEHLNFYQLYDFLLLSFWKLKKHGILILETPNVENLRVSSTTFYYDDTHVQKIPRALIGVLLEFIGFSDVEFLLLNPGHEPKKTEAERLIFGPQDLGIVAYKGGKIKHKKDVKV